MVTAEAEVERARQREELAAEQAAAEAAAEARKLQMEEEARVAEEVAVKQQQEQQEAAERELQARMDAIANETEEMARRAAKAAEEEEARRMAAVEREEWEKQRVQEAAERKAQRGRERQEREAEWARNDVLMQEYDEACGQRSSARLTAVLGTMEGNQMLAAKAAEGKELLLQWAGDDLAQAAAEEAANLAQLRSALTTAHEARDLSGLRSAVAAATGCDTLDTEVMRCKIVVQAWEMIDSRSADKLHEFAADLKRKASLGLGLEPLEAECRSYLTAWAAEVALEAALSEAREQWDGGTLEALCAEIETHGAALAKLAEQCRAAASTAQADAANCGRLEVALASEDRSLRVEALRAVATGSDTGLASPQLQKLKAQVKSEIDFMAEEEDLQQQMSAARTNRDASTLKTLLKCAGKLVAKSAAAGTEVAAREGGIVTDMGVAQQEMQCWSDEERILHRIEDAVTSHDDQELRAALGLVEQGSSLAGHDTVASGRNALGLWERQQAMCARLSSARGAENRAALEQAISEAAADESLSCSELLKEIALCKELVQSLDECGRTEDALQIAIQDGSPDSLRSAISPARRFATLTSLVAQAAELLSVAERSGALERSIATAIERRSLYALRPLVEPARAEGLAVATQAAECLKQLEREERARQHLLTALASCDSAELSVVTEQIRADSQLSAALQSELAVVQSADDVAARCFAESGQEIPVDDPVPKVASDILCGLREPSLGAQLSQWQRGTTDINAPPPEQAVQYSEDGLEEQKLEMGLEELDGIPDIDEPATLLSLNLKVNKIKQAAGDLSSCVELRELLLNDNQLEALGDIPKLRKLRQLSIDMNKVTSLDGIGDCSALRTLSASSNSIGSVKALSGCAEIEKLTLYRNHISDLNGLANLRWLQHLDLGRNVLRSIDGLGECPFLQTLILYENQIEDLKPGALQAPMLRELWLSGNPLKSLDFVQWLPSLEHLHVSDAQIYDATPLKTCGLLQTLDLSFNSVAELVDLAALASCPLMQVLRLNDNPVATLPGYKTALVSALPALRDLDNDAVDDLPTRMKQMQQAFAGAAQIDSYKLGSSAWWLNDQTGDVDWQRVLRAQSAAELTSVGNVEDVWATRTFRNSCLRQREERAELTREHKRTMRNLEAQNKSGRSSPGAGSVYGMVLKADEDGAAKARVQLTEQHNQQKNFSAKACQNVIVRNDGYASRIKQWRELIACATVQSRWRGWFVRHQIHQRRTHAAVSIQMRWATYWAKVQHANGGKEAVRIQAIVRGHHVRRRLKLALDSAKYMDDDDDDDFLAVDEDEFSMPSGLDHVWIPDMRKSVEMDLDTPEKPQAAEPRRERAAADSSTRRSQAAAAPPAAEPAAAWDEAPPSRSSDHGSDTSPVFPSVQTPSRQQPEYEHELSPTGTARSVRHDDRVAGMFDRMAQKESAVVNEWGLTDPNAIEALKKKARRTRRHDSKVKKKTMSAAQKLDHYQRTQGSSSGWSDAGSVRSTPAPSPTPPMSARSDSRMNSSLVRRIGSSVPPSPATSSLSETGGLQQFNSGQPNQRASRDLRSRGSDGSRGNGSRQTTPVTQTNNFLAAPASAPAASVPWGMAAQAGAGGRIAAPTVQRGGNAKRKKVKKHVPRVAGLAR